MYFTSVLVSSNYVLDTGEKIVKSKNQQLITTPRILTIKFFVKFKNLGLALVYLKKKNSWIKCHNFSIFRSPKRKPEDKALKEKRNQAAGQQLKASSAVLKREKPISSSDRRSVKSSSLGESTKTTRTRPSTAKSGTYFFREIEN